MTTIAYDGKTVSFDSRRTMNGKIVSDDAVKIYKCLSCPGYLVLAGTSTYCEIMAKEFVPSGEARPEVDAIGFYINESGEVFGVGVDEERRYTPSSAKLYGKHWAFGSGEEWAIAAMDHGKSAADAVRYAATRDVNTGGTVRVLDLKTLKVRLVK